MQKWYYRSDIKEIGCHRLIIFYLLEDIALYNQFSSIKQIASSLVEKDFFLDENYEMWVV